MQCHFDKKFHAIQNISYNVFSELKNHPKETQRCTDRQKKVNILLCNKKVGSFLEEAPAFAKHLGEAFSMFVAPFEKFTKWLTFGSKLISLYKTISVGTDFLIPKDYKHKPT